MPEKSHRRKASETNISEALLRASYGPERFSIEVSGWSGIAALLFLLLAFAAGVVSLMAYSANAGSHISELWKYLLIPMATLSLGFGTGAMLYRRFRETHARALRQQYEAVRARADALVRKLDDFESNARPS